MSDQDEQMQGVYGLFEKSQTVDPEIRAHVYSLVTALGGTGIHESGEYIIGDDGLACLRDLKRWLKVYDEKTNRLDVARCLAEADLVNGDLLPILSTWTEDATGNRSKLRIALACLELLVPLTWPLESTAEMTVNHHRHTPFLQQAQVRYKAGILGCSRANILRTIVRIGLPSIAVSRADRTSRDEGIIKLMLYFFRNISVISPASSLPDQGIDNEVCRSATIEAFRQQDVFALLLTLCSNMGEDFNLQDVILLDMIFNLIKGVSVEQLFMNEKQRKTQKMTDLKDALGKERGMHRDYAKIAPTRHGRFGTMIWVKRGEEKMASVSGQDNLKDDRSSLLKMDKSKKWSKPQQRRKDLAHSIYEFDRSVRLNSVASEQLRNFVEEFLDSGFNPLFTHLRKAIEREAERLLDVNYRQFFYTVSWFLQAERCRRARQKKDRENQKVQTEFEAESYGLVAGVLNQETFIAINRYMQTSLENKDWQDLNASMKCFTQILLTVQEMAQSPLEDDQEIADNIQSRIFYEETTHDRIASILKDFKDQGFGYLDACTELSHVFLRMLERYSKENTDLQIRSRRRAQRKKKEQKNNRDHETMDEEGNVEQEQDDAQSETEEIAEVAQVSRERSFDFARFAAKFSSQNSVDTFIAFTAFFRDLSVDQLKRTHRFFHRVAFKQELAVLLFRVDIVALFYRMIKGPEGLDRSHAMFKEWDELVKQVLKKMFKKLEQRPELMVELLFSKIRATMYYLEYGHDKQISAAKRAPAELEVKPTSGRDVNEQIGIVVAALLRDDQENLVRWVLEGVERTREERAAWEALAAAEKEQSTSQEGGDVAVAAASEEPKGDDTKSPVITLRVINNDIRTATAKNARLKLLLRLCGFERLGSEDRPEIPWIAPSTLTSIHLAGVQTTLKKHLETLWTDPDGNNEPEDLLRRVKQITTHTEDGQDNAEPRRDAFIDDSEGSENDSDDYLAAMFPANVRSKSDALDELKQKKSKKKLVRKRKSDANDGDDGVDQSVLDERRKAREQAALDRRRKIKSELYIRDSDEEMDEEENRTFFAREEENRRRQADRVFAALTNGTALDEDVLGQNKKRTSDGHGDGNAASKRKRRRKEAQGPKAIDIDSESDSHSQSSAPSTSSSPHTTTTTAPKKRHNRRDVETEDERQDLVDDNDNTDTPLSSQSQPSDPHTTRTSQKPHPAGTALQELPQPRIPLSPSPRSLLSKSREIEMEDIVGGVGDEGDSTDGPESHSARMQQRQRVRAGFVLDDSDDE